jgi:hypothetical protein
MTDECATTTYNQASVPRSILVSFDAKEVQVILNNAFRVYQYTREARTVKDFLMKERAALQQQQRHPFVPTPVGVLMFGWYPQRLLQHVTISKDVHR